MQSEVHMIDAAAEPHQGPAPPVPSDITLRDGRAVHLRVSCVAVESELLQAFERMSQEARHMRASCMPFASPTWSVFAA